MSVNTNFQASLKKRIVFFTAALEQGGAERVISIITKYLAQSSYQVEILLYYNRPIHYSIHPNIKITSVQAATGSKNIVKNLFYIRKFFKNHADIVISFLASFNMLSLAAHWGLNSKIAVADRSDPWFEPENPILRKLRDFLYRFADLVIVQTEHNKTYFSKSIQKKIAVINNPVDLGDKKGLALNTPKQDKIVAVGRLMPQKNQALLIKAFCLIKKDFPNYTITFYGKGPQIIYLQETARELGLEKQVFFAGNIKNIFEEISNAKLFVLTSDYEGMPNALVEAMCLGLPVISTEVSGALEMIENGKSGFLIPKRDADKLAQAMRKVLSDSNLQKTLGQQAVKLNEILQVSTVVKKWISFIIQLDNK